ncbi:MAG: hypothetical protein Q8L07_15190 [Sediminibacterium sp.]|nr:hypothetical protein [Sediminibacterium sp.]
MICFHFQHFVPIWFPGKWTGFLTLEVVHFSPGIWYTFQSVYTQTTIDVKLENETIWLNLNQMATLFERDKSIISRHFSNVFKEWELD